MRCREIGRPPPAFLSRRRCAGDSVDGSPRKPDYVDQKLVYFIDQLNQPDYTLIGMNRAKETYGLDENDMKNILADPNNWKMKDTAYASAADPTHPSEGMEVFVKVWRKPVIEYALKKYSRRYLITRYKHFIGRPDKVKDGEPWHKRPYNSESEHIQMPEMAQQASVKDEEAPDPAGVFNQQHEFANESIFGELPEQTGEAAARSRARSALERINAMMPWGLPVVKRLKTEEEVDGLEPIKTSLHSNTAIFTIKIMTWAFTGSAAIFAEAMHTLTDVLNSLYRLDALKDSARKADAKHPYGYDRDRYIAANNSFILLCLVGGAYPLLCGFKALLDPDPIMYYGALYCVFSGSAIFEARTLLSATKEIREQVMEHVPGQRLLGKRLSAHEKDRMAAGLGSSIPMDRIRARMKQFLAAEVPKEDINSPNPLKRGRALWSAVLYNTDDIMTRAAFLESVLGIGSAVLGVGGIYLAQVTGLSHYDAGASVCIAGSVGYMGYWLIRDNQRFLRGMALPITTVSHAVERLESEPSVTAVHDVKTELLGVDSVRFKAEIEFNAEYITKQAIKAGAFDSETPYDWQHEYETRLAAKDAAQGARKLTGWTMKNNALFLLALGREINRLEKIVTEETLLRGYKRVHIDFEPF